MDPRLAAIPSPHSQQDPCQFSGKLGDRFSSVFGLLWIGLTNSCLKALCGPRDTAWEHLLAEMALEAPGGAWPRWREGVVMQPVTSPPLSASNPFQTLCRAVMRPDCHSVFTGCLKPLVQEALALGPHMTILWFPHFVLILSKKVSGPAWWSSG